MGSREPFFYEEWAFLARIDPALFETHRRQLIDEFLIAAGSERQKEEGARLQREIDATIQGASDSKAALLAIARMLCGQLSHLGEELSALKTQLLSLPQTGHEASTSGFSARREIRP